MNTPDTDQLEKDLMSALQIFVTGLMSRIKYCKNDNCDKLFLADNDIHVYCNPKCRHNQQMRTYKNKIKGE